MKINVNKEEKVIKTLETVQKGCSARTIDIDDIKYTIRKAEKHYFEKLNISKVAWKGSRIEIDTHCKYSHRSGQKKSSGTVIILERGANAWFVVDCERFESWQYEGVNQVIFSEIALENMKKNNRVNTL